MRSPVIVALDVNSKPQLQALLAHLDPMRCRVKIGKELFTSLGPDAVDLCHAGGFEVFLDLKFHDIPNTCAGAVRAAAGLGVWMVNVHCSGGPQMLEAAREAIDASAHQPLLIGVTVLTSMQPVDLERMGIHHSLDEQVDRMAALAQAASLDGVVCSAREAARLRAMHGDKFCLVTPGIRPLWAESNDQARIVSPNDALNAGSTHLVIGRPITQAADPQAALARIFEEI